MRRVAWSDGFGGKFTEDRMNIETGKDAIEAWKSNEGWQFADREAAWQWFFEQGQKASGSWALLAALQDKDTLLHRCEELRALLFYNTKILPGDKLFEFSSKQQWINKAQQIWKFHEVRAADTICVDQLGRLCNIGKHFIDAERDNAYPIEVFRMREDMTPNAALRGDSGLIAGVPLESTVMQED